MHAHRTPAIQPRHTSPVTQHPTPPQTQQTANGQCIRIPLLSCRFAAPASTRGMAAFTIIGHPKALLSKYQDSRIGSPTATSRAPSISIKLSTSFCDSGSLGTANSMTRRAERGRNMAFTPNMIGMRPARAAMLGRRWCSAGSVILKVRFGLKLERAF